MVDIRRGAGGIDTTGGRGFAGPGRSVPRMAPDRVRAERVVSWADTAAPQFYRQVTDRLARAATDMVEVQAASNIARLELDLRSKAIELSTKHEADAEGFHASYGAYVEGLLGTVDPALRPAIERRAATRGMEAGSRLMEEQIRRGRETGRADVLGALSALQRDAANAAAGGNSELLDAYTTDFGEGVDLALRQGLLTGTEAASLRDKWREEIRTETILAYHGRAIEETAPPAGVGGLSFDELKARAWRQESGGRQFGADGEPLTSPKGAVGVAQVTEAAGKEAAAELGIDWDAKRWRSDEGYNELLGSTYLRMQLERYGGRQALALSGYNAGPGNTDAYIRQTVAKHGPEFTDAQFIATVEETQKRVTSGRGEAARSETADYIRNILGMAPGTGGLRFVADFAAFDDPDLSPAEKRAAVSGMYQLIDRRDRINERAERQADEARRKAAEERATSLAVDVLDGNVDALDLRNALAAREIDRQQFSWLDGLRTAPETVADDPAASVVLFREALEGAPGTDRRLAEARAAGAIRAETAVSYLRTWDESRRRGDLAAPDVKAQLERIDQTIGGVRGPLAVLDSSASERVQRALQEYRQRWQQDPTQSPVQLADDIIGRYRLAPADPTVFPRPRFLVGSRWQPDVTATMRATLEAVEAGRITADEAAREIETLEQIEEALRERQSRQREGR